jgi:hypothetical protein
LRSTQSCVRIANAGATNTTSLIMAMPTMPVVPVGACEIPPLGPPPEGFPRKLGALHSARRKS